MPHRSICRAKFLQCDQDDHHTTTSSITYSQHLHLVSLSICPHASRSVAHLTRSVSLSLPLSSHGYGLPVSSDTLLISCIFIFFFFFHSSLHQYTYPPLCLFVLLGYLSSSQAVSPHWVLWTGSRISSYPYLPSWTFLTLPVWYALAARSCYDFPFSSLFVTGYHYLY